VVQPGQTLWRIARTYGLTPEELARANGIEDPTRISAGLSLFVPGASRTLEVPTYPVPPGRPDRPGTDSPQESTGPSADWIWPVERSRILSYYGAPRKGHRHGGIDIGGDHGQPVLAARSGRVVYSGSGMRGYGKTVILDHGDGFQSLYAHNSRLLVRVGQRVEQGTPVALLGRTGNATADHCHFEIRREDRPLDPLLYLLRPLEAQR
jgi:murein DD-endopeptidase MepM/ murein hydrolase activator NlpD